MYDSTISQHFADQNFVIIPMFREMAKIIPVNNIWLYGMYTSKLLDIIESLHCLFGDTVNLLI